ncbi:glycosyltransferase family 4 protein [Microbacterium sp. NPDC057659]|uniref:glycosyltransferase family 4 protein n=1 Tax=Microbacterium sp. NPDC057659 TaxID=3346198 RepID=UPI00366C9E95
MVVVTAEVTARLFMRGYVEFLSRSGYEVMLVADDLSALREPLFERGVRAMSLPMSRDPAPLRDLVSLIRMASLIARARPDAVVYATPKASLLASIAARVLGVPLRVYELWGIRFETARGAARALYRGIERVIATCSTVVVANSASLAARAAEFGITGADHVIVLGEGSSHGVDSKHFSPLAEVPEIDEATAAFLAEHEGITLGFVGRLHPDKGIDTLMAAASRLAEQGEDVRVLLVGGAEGAAVEFPPGVAVHLTGEVMDVRPYLGVFDVLVLMSRREGFPNVVLEAASMEVPAIVSDATGCVDSVIDGVTGYVVPTGDVDALGSVITELAGDPVALRALGVAARRRAVKTFDPEHVWRLSEEHLRSQLERALRRRTASR